LRASCDFLTRHGLSKNDQKSEKKRSDRLEEKSEKSERPPGPEPEVLEIEDDWKDAMRNLISKKRPVGGWPKDWP